MFIIQIDCFLLLQKYQRMTEIEVPIEKVQEDIHHAVHHGDGLSNKNMSQAALLSALLAVLAAVAALFAGHFANEAMIEQIQASDSWAYYQAKGIKKAIADLKTVHAPESADAVEKYKHDQKEIKKEAQAKEVESRMHLHKHETLATAVTFFQVAIAMTAIAVLVRKRHFLLSSMGLGLFGLFFIIKGFLIG